MKNIIKELENLDEIIITNQNVDWSENDPVAEFETLSHLVKAIIEKAKGSIPSDRDSMINKLSQFLSYDDDSEVETSLENLEAQAKIDDTVMVDYVDDIQVIEQFEFTFTVKDLLQQIS